MEAFLSRKKRKLDEDSGAAPATTGQKAGGDEDEETTDIKLATLASLHSDKDHSVLLDYLLAYDGSVEEASQALSGHPSVPPKRNAVNRYQSSLTMFAKAPTGDARPQPTSKQMPKRGKTLHLYSPADIEANTPCSIIHNFLPTERADALLQELLAEVPKFRKDTFQLFDRTVESPHTMRFYVDSFDEVKDQRSRYVYNGSYVTDVAQTTPEMLKVSGTVREAVNKEIERRSRDFNPDGKKLKFQSPDEWVPNASFVNCYDGGKESVGYHTDQLTYLGPRAVIGSLSLGVAREFRVRRIVPPDADGKPVADTQGQIAIHLPHNSLLVMHAAMQEEWKHAVAPAQAIDPHPLAGNKRINITYRCYKAYLHPDHTPRCKCKVPAVLRCVQRRAATKGRYMWMCHSNYTPGQSGCGYFQWAEFDEDGQPAWAKDYKGNANLPAAAAASTSDPER